MIHGDETDPLGVVYKFRQRIEGKWFMSEAHCIEYNKAKARKEDEIAVQILMTTDPMEACRLGARVRGDNEWEERRERLVHRLLEGKLEGCLPFREALDGAVGEIRVRGEDEKWTKGRSGRGQNWLGRVLMRSRETRRASMGDEKMGREKRADLQGETPKGREEGAVEAENTE